MERPREQAENNATPRQWESPPWTKPGANQAEATPTSEKKLVPVFVTRAQRMAAQTVIEELERQGKPIPHSTVKIANARRMSNEERKEYIKSHPEKFRK